MEHQEPTWRTAYPEEVTGADESLRPSWVPGDLVLIPSLSRDGLRRRTWNQQEQLRQWAEEALTRKVRDERFARVNAVIDEQTDMTRCVGPVLEGIRETDIYEVVVMAKIYEGPNHPPGWVAANSTSSWLSDDQMNEHIDELMFWRMARRAGGR